MATDNKTEDPFADFNSEAFSHGVSASGDQGKETADDDVRKDAREDDSASGDRQADGEDPLASFRDEPDGDDGENEDEDVDGADDEEDDQDDGEPDQDEKPRKKASAKARIAELTKARREAERRAEAAERRLQEREQAARQDSPQGQQDDEKPKEKPKAKITPVGEDGKPLAKPDPKDFKYGEVDVDYMSALTEYTAAHARAVVQHEYQQQRQRDAAEAQLQEMREGWENVVETGRKSIKDFDKVVLEAGERGDYKLTQSMFELAAVSEFGAHVLHHLATNPKQAEKIAGLSEREQARHLGRLEAAIETSLKGEDKGKGKSRKRVPGAAPLPDTRTPRGSGGQFASPAEMSFGDFEKHLDAQRAKDSKR
jgi:hypothetical protein